MTEPHSTQTRIVDLERRGGAEVKQIKFCGGNKVHEVNSVFKQTVKTMRLTWASPFLVLGRTYSTNKASVQQDQPFMTSGGTVTAVINVKHVGRVVQEATFTTRLAV